MENLFVFMLAFVIILSVFLVIYFIKKRRHELGDSKEISLIVAKYQLRRKNLNYEALGLVFALINSLIIASVGTLISAIPLDSIWRFAIGFVLLMALLYISYHIVGLILKRKENKNGKL